MLSDFVLYQISSVEEMMDRVKEIIRLRYHDIVQDPDILNDPRDDEYCMMNYLRSGIALSPKRLHYNLYRNILFSILTTGTFLLCDPSNKFSFYVKTVISNGLVYYFSRMKENGRLNEIEDLIHDYLTIPESYEKLRNNYKEFDGNADFMDYESDYLLALMITESNRVINKMGFHIYNDWNTLRITTNYFPLLNHSGILTSPVAPEILYAREFWNMYSIKTDLYTKKDSPYQLEKREQTFIRSTMFLDFLCGTNYYNHLKFVDSDKFVEENKEIINIVSENLLKFVTDALQTVMIREKRVYEMNRMGDFLYHTGISRYMVYHWNGGEKRMYLPFNGTKWWESDEKMYSDHKSWILMRDSLIQEYHNEAITFSGLLENIWRGNV